MSVAPTLPGALGWTVVQTVGAFWLGDTVGVLLRRRLPPGAILTVGLTAVAAAVALSALTGGPGAWDLSLSGLCCLLGLARAGWQVPWSRVGWRVGQGALLVAVAEVGVRVALGSPPGLAWPARAPFAATADREPDANGGSWAMMVDACALGWSGEPEPGVLHLGDSVVYGTGVTTEERFVHHLSARDDLPHAAAASPGVSVDLLLLAARRRVGAITDQAVLYVDAFNDLQELDVPLPCCPGRPLLTPDLQATCDAPGDLGPVRVWWLRSPPPFALRVAAEGSDLAAWLWAAWADLLRSVPWTSAGADHPDRALPRVVAVAERFVAEAQAAGAAPVVVFLPDVHVISGRPLDLAAPGRHEALRGALVASGVPLIDATPFYLSGGGDPLDLTLDGVHLTPAAHEVFAAWLQPRLQGAREGSQARGVPADGEGDNRPSTP